MKSGKAPALRKWIKKGFENWRRYTRADEALRISNVPLDRLRGEQYLHSLEMASAGFHPLFPDCGAMELPGWPPPHTMARSSSRRGNFAMLTRTSLMPAALRLSTLNC